MADRRRFALAITGAVLAVAAVVAVVLVALGDGDDGDDGPVAPDVLPAALTAPADTSGVIDVDGRPAALSQEELDAVVAVVEGYLGEATVDPLSRPPSDETTTTAADDPGLEALFADAVKGRLQGGDILALSDAHLGFAEGGVLTDRATLSLSGVVQDGSAQFLNAAIDVVMVVRGDQPVTVKRTGDLVLRLVDGQWKIAAYKIKAEREFGDLTTTSEAAS